RHGRRAELPHVHTVRRGYGSRRVRCTYGAACSQPDSSCPRRERARRRVPRGDDAGARVKIILVAIVFDGLVPAVGPVLMIVSVVYRVIRFHRSLSLSPASSLGERCSWPYARAVTLCVVSIERRSTSLAAVISARTRHDHP